MAPEIILFGYDQSPYFQKLKLILLFKELPFKLVKVSRILPRPELTSLGINYRRIPILSIGGSVYCDTAVAVSALENVFPQKYLGWKENVAVNLQERAIFSIAFGLLDKSIWTGSFLADRELFSGAKIDGQKLETLRPQFLTSLRIQIKTIENRLEARTSSLHFILDTKEPTYTDLALFFINDWVSNFGTADSIYLSNDFPQFNQWLISIRSLISIKRAASPTQGKGTLITAEQASVLLYAATPIEIINDENEPLLVARWLKIGGDVEVTPDDVGKTAQAGKLVAINSEEIVIRVQNDEGKYLNVHTPRIGFRIVEVKKEKL